MNKTIKNLKNNLVFDLFELFEERQSFPSIKAIHRRLVCSWTTLNQLIDALAEMNLLRKEKRGNKIYVKATNRGLRMKSLLLSIQKLLKTPD